MVSRGAGSVRIQFEELFYTLKMETGKTEMGVSIPMHPGGAEVKHMAEHLKNMAKIYERMQWHSLSIHYTGALGSTEGGVIVLGFDYDSDVQAKIDMGVVSVMQPSVTFNAYAQPGKVLNVPVARMQPQKWLSTEGTESHMGSVNVFASGTKLAGQTFGYLRVRYDVTLAGPHKA